VKAVRLHAFHQQPVIDEVPEPTISGPLDVIVKIGGAGVCRTDLHIIEGQWDAAMGTPLPAEAAPLHLRRARTTRVSIEANAGLCRGMLRHRYHTSGLGEEEQ